MPEHLVRQAPTRYVRYDRHDPMSASTYDLVVIGSGPAGQKAALAAAKLGKRVAIIDRRAALGGVCIHTGTIPSKAIREAVMHLTAFNERQVFGHTYANTRREITMADLLHRCQHVVRAESDVIRNQMARNGIIVLAGHASFVDPHTIRVCAGSEGDDVHDLHAANVLVAVGTEPARPASVPFTAGRVIDSDEMLSLTALPKSLIVVGGGVIGTEYACMLAAAGVRVTLVDTRPRLLEFVDDEIGESLQFRLRDMGVRLRLGESVAKIEIIDGHVEATLNSHKTLRADTLLYAIGRQGATAMMNLAAAGLNADERGRLRVNEFY